MKVLKLLFLIFLIIFGIFIFYPQIFPKTLRQNPNFIDLHKKTYEKTSIFLKNLEKEKQEVSQTFDIKSSSSTTKTFIDKAQYLYCKQIIEEYENQENKKTSVK